ncbi:5'-3' exonuclease [Pseudonocardia sichuanensis]
MLLDAASLYFRSFYGVPESITAPDGTPVNAVRGFTDMVARLITDRRPSRLVACLDLDWRPAFRVEALPSYKAHRVPGEPEVAPAGLPEEVPDLLAPQVPVLLEVLAAAGIATGGAEGYEADDVIGTLAAGERTDPVLAVSGDRDLMQIVRDEPVPVRLLYVGRGLAKAEHLGPVEVAAKYGVPVARAGEAYAEMAMLRGDPSDGLPGVPGVGAKTAATLVGRFGSWDELRAAVTDRTDTRLSPPVRTKLAAAAPYLSVVEPVVRVALDAPVELDRPDALPVEPVDPDRLDALAERWGIGSSIERLRAALARNAR